MKKYAVVSLGKTPSSISGKPSTKYKNGEALTNKESITKEINTVKGLLKKNLNKTK